jgi:hypothetical protein
VAVLMERWPGLREAAAALQKGGAAPAAPAAGSPTAPQGTAIK